MTTTVSYIKGGIRLQCDQSAYPAEEPQTAYPIPNFPGVQTAQITAALVAVSGQGASGILVTSTGPLPAPDAEWTLYDQAWQGSAPSPLPTPTAIPVALTNGALFYSLTTPLAGATHVLWLESVDGNTTTTYPPVSIATPTDPTSGNISAAAAAAADAQSTANAAQPGSATLTALSTAPYPNPAGTYGSTTKVPVMVVDEYGRVTGVTLATITGGGTSGAGNPADNVVLAIQFGGF